MISRESVVSEARTWLGTRWHHQGAVRGVGCDCIGLVVGVARALGVREAFMFADDPEIAGYGRQPDHAMLLRACDRYLDRRLSPRPEAGDILLLRFEQEPQHFAIATPHNMIHALAQSRKVVEHRIDGVWRSRLVAIFSYRGVG